MQHRSRNVIAALLAATLLATAGFAGTALAHGPRDPGPGFPGTSAKPLPSGWSWPSGDIHTAKPEKSKKPEPSKPAKDPKPPKTPGLVCTPVVTPTGSPAPTAVVTGDSSTSLMHAMLPKSDKDWSKLSSDARQRLNDEWKKVACTIDLLQTAIDRQIDGRIKSLQNLSKQVAKIGLGSSDLAVVNGEINSLIADLQALKVKADAETTIAGLQADLATLNGKGAAYKSVGLWVRLIIQSEGVLAQGPKLTALEAKIAADIAAAPASTEKADAQIFLADLKVAADASQALAAPLPAILLAITPAQLADGSAKTTLDAARKTLGLAQWDLHLARWAAFWAEMELKHPEVHTPAPTSVPTAAPTL